MATAAAAATLDRELETSLSLLREGLPARATAVRNRIHDAVDADAIART